MSIPPIMEIENFGCLDTSFDQGQSLRQGSRVQSRFRGTRTMQYTPVTCGTVHFFRGTHTLPYASWRSTCQSERTPALSEITPSGVVSWTERVERESEWRNSREADRIAQWNQVGIWNCATEHERQRWRDEQTKQERVWSSIKNWGANPVSFLRKNGLSLEFRRGDCHFVREFFNFKPAINKSSQRLNRNWRETDRIHSQLKTNDRNESKTGQLYNKESRIITTVITSSNYWRVLIYVLGIRKIPNESRQEGRNVVKILWLLNIFHSILDSLWLP